MVAGIRMLDQPYMTDLIEANSMGHEPNLIDIYSASWGPTDDGRTVDGPRNATMRAIVRGVNEVMKYPKFQSISMMPLLYTKLQNHIRYIVNRIIFNNRAVRVLETSMFGLVEMEEKMTIATVTGMCTFNKAIFGIY